MKTTDIQIAAEYAMTGNRDLRYSTRFGGDRVVVMAKGEPYRARQWGSTTKVGVRVVVLNRKTGEPKTYGETFHDVEKRGRPIVYVVRCVDIREPWAEYWERALRSDKVRDEVEQETRERADRIKGRVAALNALLPEDEQLREYAKEIKIDSAVFARLLDAATLWQAGEGGHGWRP